MNDSLDIVFQDSIYNTMSVMSSNLDSMMKTSNFDIWLPLVSALLGGVIAIIVHWIAKCLDRRAEQKKEEIEIQATIHSLFTQLNYQLKNLSYYKHDLQLQLLQMKLTEDKELKTKYYD